MQSAIALGLLEIVSTVSRDGNLYHGKGPSKTRSPLLRGPATETGRNPPHGGIIVTTDYVEFVARLRLIT